MKLQSISTGALLFAELSHVFCCGLPIFIAVMSAGSQVGFGGVFATFHDLIHNYEHVILIASGLLLALGLGLHYISFQINCRTVGCKSVHSDCTPQKFRSGWIYTIALALYAVNLAFYILSGHGAHAH